MAATLNELAKVTPGAFEKAVLEDLLRQSKVLQMAPIQSVNSLKITTARWQTLPSVSTRAVDGSWSDSTGKLENTQESLFVYGGEINVDRVLELDKSVVESPLTTQTKMKIAALAAKTTTDFILGNHATDPYGIEGLKVRVANAPSRQTVDLGTSSGTVTLKALADAASEHTFIDGLHQLLHVIGATDTPGQCALYMNETTYLGVGRVLRRLGLLDTTQDNYGRVWKEFAGVKLVDIGLQGDQSTEIISNALYADAVGTEIYGVRWGGNDGFRVIQLAGTSPIPYDPAGNEMQSKPSKMRRIDWAIGLENRGKYAIGKLHGFKMAAS